MSRSKIHGRCKLCLSEKVLLDSHIIPELFFKYEHGDDHRAMEITVEPYMEKTIQKAYRENILCIDCERRLNKYETYAGNIWDKTFPRHVNSRHIEIHQIDYKKFKLLHLSILWRSSVSSRDEFKQVNLGPHEEKIRKMILDENPGAGDEYSFFGSVIHLENKVIFPFIEPMMSKMTPFTAYSFYYGGVAWIYLVSAVSSKRFSDRIPYFNENGKLFLVAEDIMKNPHVDHFILKAKQIESLDELRKWKRK